MVGNGFSWPVMSVIRMGGSECPVEGMRSLRRRGVRLVGDGERGGGGGEDIPGHGILVNTWAGE